MLVLIKYFYYVVVTYVALLLSFFQSSLVISDCNFALSISGQMTLANITAIQATKLFDRYGSSKFLCIHACIYDVTCYYMNINTDKGLCIGYTLGSTSYNIMSSVIYVLKSRKVEVYNHFLPVYSFYKFNQCILHLLPELH